MDPELKDVLADASGVLFLCSGNMVRSAFADRYARYRYARHRGCALPVHSAATMYENEGIHPTAVRALLRLGLSRAEIAGFRSTTLHEMRAGLDPRWIVFGMTAEHVTAMSLHPELRVRTFLLTRLLGRQEPIEDPLFQGHWDEAFDSIRRCVDALVSGLADPAAGAHRKA